MTDKISNVRTILLVIAILLTILVIYVVVSNIFFWSYMYDVSLLTSMLNIVGDLGTWAGAIASFVSVIILGATLHGQNKEWKRLRKERVFDIFNDRLWHQINIFTDAENKVQIEYRYIDEDIIQENKCTYKGNEAFQSLCSDYDEIHYCLSNECFPKDYSIEFISQITKEIEELGSHPALVEPYFSKEERERAEKPLNDKHKEITQSLTVDTYKIQKEEWTRYKHMQDKEKQLKEIDTLLNRHQKGIWVYLKTITCICRNCAQFCDNNKLTGKERKEIINLILPLLSQDEVKFLRIVSPKYTDLKFLFE